jgi:hypothetical protein
MFHHSQALRSRWMGSLERHRKVTIGCSKVFRLLLRRFYVETVLTVGCALHSGFRMLARENYGLTRSITMDVILKKLSFSFTTNMTLLVLWRLQGSPFLLRRMTIFLDWVLCSTHGTVKRRVDLSVSVADLMGKRLLAHLQAMIFGAVVIPRIIVLLSALVTTIMKMSIYLNVQSNVRQDIANSITMVTFVIPQAWMGILIAMV